MKKKNRPNRGLGTTGLKRGIPKGRTTRYEFGGNAKLKLKVRDVNKEN